MNILKMLKEKAKRFTILYVEDQEELRESVVLFLEKFFNIVEYAEDGVEALEKYNNGHYDIVLTDIQMPNMNGLELSTEIKKINQDTQVIILSAFDNKDYLLEAIEIGVDHYIMKPMNMNSMTATLLKSIKTLELIDELERHKELIIHHSRNASMSDMLFYISHHWRQPLNAVGVAIQSIPLMYELGKLDKDQLNKQVDSSMNLIQDLSSSLNQFGSLFDNSSEDSFKPMEAIDEISMLLIDAFKNDNIDISYIYNDKDESKKVKINGDVCEFKQVILSILNNSREAIHSAKENKNLENGKIIFNIVNHQNSIDITIEDNGGGIDNDILDKVFDPFFTTHNIANKKGLGLYIAQMIISNKMGGRLKLENYDDGLKVIINLPKL